MKTTLLNQPINQPINQPTNQKINYLQCLIIWSILFIIITIKTTSLKSTTLMALLGHQESDGHHCINWKPINSGMVQIQRPDIPVDSQQV
jgi:hypothetical protein